MSIMVEFFPGLKNQIFTTFLCLKHKINERWDIWPQILPNKRVNDIAV